MSSQSLYDIISNLSLTSGLKLCLDAGDSNSYDPATQTAKWLDTSGNGYDFFRGTSTAGDSAEPTFNGSAGGKSSNEYWSFDGGDSFIYDLSNESWMNNLHKDSAVFSAVAVFYNVGSGSTYNHFGNTTSTTGVIFAKNSSNQLRMFVRNGSGATVFNFTSSKTKTDEGWTFMGVSVNEPINSMECRFDDAQETSGCTYSSPSTGGAQQTMRVASNSGAAYPSGSRLACLAIWEGVALSQSEITSVYQEIMQRFGAIVDLSKTQDDNSIDSELAVQALVDLSQIQQSDSLSSLIDGEPGFDFSSINGASINQYTINGNFVSSTADSVLLQSDNAVNFDASIQVQSSLSVNQNENVVSSILVNAVTGNSLSQKDSNQLTSHLDVIASPYLNQLQDSNSVAGVAVNLNTGSALMSSDNDTASASGGLEIVSDLIVNQQSDSSAINTTVLTTASASYIQNNDSISGYIDVVSSPEFIQTQDSHFVNSDSSLTVTASASVSEDGNSAVSQGYVSIVANSLINESNNQLVAELNNSIDLIGFYIQQNDSVQSSSQVEIKAVSAIDQQNNPLVSIGSISIKSDTNKNQDVNQLISVIEFVVGAHASKMQDEFLITSSGLVAISSIVSLQSDFQILIADGALSIFGNAGINQSNMILVSKFRSSGMKKRNINADIEQIYSPGSLSQRINNSNLSERHLASSLVKRNRHGTINN